MLNEAHSLGVLFNSVLSLDSSGAAVMGDVFLQPGMVHELAFLSGPDLTIVIDAIVQLCLDYCNRLNMWLPLNIVQNFWLI